MRRVGQQRLTRLLEVHTLVFRSDVVISANIACFMYDSIARGGCSRASAFHGAQDQGSIWTDGKLLSVCEIMVSPLQCIRSRLTVLPVLPDYRSKRPRPSLQPTLCLIDPSRYRTLGDERLAPATLPSLVKHPLSFQLTLCVSGPPARFEVMMKSCVGLVEEDLQRRLGPEERRWPSRNNAAWCSLRCPRTG